MVKNSLFALFLSAGFISPSSGKGQTPDTVASYSINAYVDVYYAAYSDSVGSGNFQKFPTVSPRSNSVGLNSFQLATRYDGRKIRGMATLHFGDIAKSAWSASNNIIQEAHLGIRICKTLWVDAGFFRTHFGTEYLLPVENIASSIAVPTWYEPYYEAGARLNYDPTDKLEINLFLLNGYGIFEDNNKKKSLGLGVTYAVNDHTGIGYTNYVGDDSPDGTSASQLRVAQNLFFNYNGKRTKLQVGGDIYFQQHSDISNSNESATAWSGLITAGYMLLPGFEIYGRGEVFNDPNGFLTGVITNAKGIATGYKLWGGTAGLEYKPTENSYVRLEGRRLQMNEDQKIFLDHGESRNYRYEIMLNAGISFSVLKGVQTRN